MEAIHRILTYRVSTKDAAGKIGQMACYVAAVVVLALGLRKLNALAADMNEAELFFGILLVLATGLLMVCLGTLTRLAAMWTHAVSVQVEKSD